MNDGDKRYGWMRWKNFKVRQKKDLLFAGRLTAQQIAENRARAITIRGVAPQTQTAALVVPPAPASTAAAGTPHIESEDDWDTLEQPVAAASTTRIGPEPFRYDYARFNPYKGLGRRGQRFSHELTEDLIQPTALLRAAELHAAAKSKPANPVELSVPALATPAPAQRFPSLGLNLGLSAPPKPASAPTPARNDQPGEYMQAFLQQGDRGKAAASDTAKEKDNTVYEVTTGAKRGILGIPDPHSTLVRKSDGYYVRLLTGEYGGVLEVPIKDVVECDSADVHHALSDVPDAKKPAVLKRFNAATGSFKLAAQHSITNARLRKGVDEARAKKARSEAMYAEAAAAPEAFIKSLGLQDEGPTPEQNKQYQQLIRAKSRAEAEAKTARALVAEIEREEKQQREMLIRAETLWQHHLLPEGAADKAALKLRTNYVEEDDRHILRPTKPEDYERARQLASVPGRLEYVQGLLREGRRIQRRNIGHLAEQKAPERDKPQDFIDRAHALWKNFEDPAYAKSFAYKPTKEDVDEANLVRNNFQFWKLGNMLPPTEPKFDPADANLTPELLHEFDQRAREIQQLRQKGDMDAVYALQQKWYDEYVAMLATTEDPDVIDTQRAMLAMSGINVKPPEDYDMGPREHIAFQRNEWMVKNFKKAQALREQFASDGRVVSAPQTPAAPSKTKAATGVAPAEAEAAASTIAPSPATMPYKPFGKQPSNSFIANAYQALNDACRRGDIRAMSRVSQADASQRYRIKPGEFDSITKFVKPDANTPYIRVSLTKDKNKSAIVPLSQVILVGKHERIPPGALQFLKESVAATQHAGYRKLFFADTQEEAKAQVDALQAELKSRPFIHPSALPLAGTKRSLEPSVPTAAPAPAPVIDLVSDSSPEAPAPRKKARQDELFSDQVKLSDRAADALTIAMNVFPTEPDWAKLVQGTTVAKDNHAPIGYLQAGPELDRERQATNFFVPSSNAPAFTQTSVQERPDVQDAQLDEHGAGFRGFGFDGGDGGGEGGALSKALSGDEVNQAAGGGVQVLRYPDLANMQSWNELVSSPAKAAAVLFLTTSPTSGHWLGAFNAPDGAHVFDPIGLALDTERTHISSQERNALGEDQPQFKRLLQTAGQPVHVSRVDFQANKPDINTCGRWVALRIKQRNMPDAQFAAWVKQSAQQAGAQTLDDWVVSQT